MANADFVLARRIPFGCVEMPLALSLSLLLAPPAALGVLDLRPCVVSALYLGAGCRRMMGCMTVSFTSKRKKHPQNKYYNKQSSDVFFSRLVAGIFVYYAFGSGPLWFRMKTLSPGTGLRHLLIILFPLQVWRGPLCTRSPPPSTPTPCSAPKFHKLPLGK